MAPRLISLEKNVQLMICREGKPSNVPLIVWMCNRIVVAVHNYLFNLLSLISKRSEFLRFGIGISQMNLVFRIHLVFSLIMWCFCWTGEYGYGFFSEKHRSTDELSSNCCNTLQQIFILTNPMVSGAL